MNDLELSNNGNQKKRRLTATRSKFVIFSLDTETVFRDESYIVTIADEVVPDLQNGGEQALSRRALELLAVDGHRNLSAYQVRVILGLTTALTWMPC